MIVGKESVINYLNTTVTGSKTYLPGYPRDNILYSPTLQTWAAKEYPQTLTLVFTTPITFRLIALLNVVCEDSVTIDLYDDVDALIGTKTILTENLTGIRYKDTFFLLPGEVAVKKILLTFTGTDPDFSSSLGYIWAGDIIDFGCIEKITPVDNSNDSVTVSRGNTSNSQTDYLYRNYAIIINKANVLRDLQNKIRAILLTGYGTPRPVIFTEPLFNPEECCFGIFDAGKFQYDIFIAGDDYLAQIVLGIREVF